MLKVFSAATAIACIFLMPVLDAGAAPRGNRGMKADESGFASMHAWRRVGGKTCFVDHSHEGSGSGATQQAAMSDAIKSWQSFTALEYGSDWASYANSIAKSASCNRGSSTVSCSISSIPCKGGVMGRKRR